LILLPAATGFGPTDRHDRPLVNLSYWVFPVLEHLRALWGKADWDAISKTGETLIRSSRFGKRRIPTNWIGLVGNEPAPAQFFPAVFGYDAIRIPLYLAWGVLLPAMRCDRFRRSTWPSLTQTQVRHEKCSEIPITRQLRRSHNV
jgi:endo-1,4-beta-D-glucanase Y